MLDWNDLQYLLALQRYSNLNQAAEALDVNRTTVSRRIEQLEQNLGASLVEKVGRELILTKAGQETIAAAEIIEGEIHSLERRVFGRDDLLAGKIRLTAPPGLSTLLAPELAQFQTENPDVLLEISATLQVEDLEMMESDVAIRMTRKPPDDLAGKCVAKPVTAVYANAKLAKQGVDLENGNYIGTNVTYAQASDPDAAMRTLISSSTDLIRELVAIGHGIAYLPCYLGELDSRLVRVSQPKTDHLPDIWLLYHPRLRTQLRVRKFVDRLSEGFARLQPMIEGSSGD